ncbi:hypothetical protein FSP39_009023 [Pinctada imbricata]|uniref:Uncharacterized protein n=1 Tax=Pinctada imbricata TaxID=66713 RepID=A0AA88XKV6_PINIB|nr:hypothetical protein FSP39_009023 [Pinctada imbricata]
MATISACVTDKRTKVLFTVVSEVFEQYRFVLDRLLSAESIINFSDPQYELTLKEKYEILHAHLRANDITIRHGLRPSGHASPVSDENAKYIYEDDAQEILLKRPICGFPQSCHIFCKNPTFLFRGHSFFDDPPKELLHLLRNMVKSEGEQFVILLYAYKNSGKINLNSLNEHQISILFDEVSVALPRNIESCIRKHIEDLRGKFLVERFMDNFEFPHSSIQRAVALSYSKLSKRAKLDVISMLSTTAIVDLVKPRSESDDIDSSVIHVSTESYSDLVDLFTQRITEGDLALFKCSLFLNEEFISMFVPSYLESSEKSISSQLRFIFRYGLINLAKAVLVAWHSTVDDLKDNDYESFMKESSIHRHSTAVQYLINDRQDSFQKTTSMIKCLECSIQNDEITSILVRNLSVNKLDNTQEKAILKVVTRNESLTSFQFFIETARMQSEMLGYVADLAGRRNAHNCINFLLERYSSDMNDIIIDSTRGACKGGHDRLIDWAIEHYPELIKNKAADFLLHVELPSTLEKLHLRYNSVISKLEFSETLNTLCGKGKSLCVKVLLDRCDLFSEPDIQNAMRAAVKRGHLKTVNVIMETFSVPQDMVSELIETVRQSDNMRPHSAYPFTPAHTPASVLSQNIFTPCSFEQTQKRHSKALCLKRAKSNGYLSEEGNVYRRAYQTLCTIRDNNKDRESKLHQCEELIKSIPEKYEDLILQSALHSLNDEELFSIFLRKNSTIWKAVFSACRNDRKQIENLIKSTMKHYRCRGQPFLPSLIDFAIQNNENISDFIDLLIETHCNFEVDEFNSTLSNLIVTHKENAEILVQNVEEMTLENSVFLPLTMCCRSNQIDVFKFIWDNISYQKDVFLDLLSKDIVDQDGKALDIILPDITRQISISEVLLKCFQKHSRKWILKLSSTHQQELLNSTELIKSELFKENDPATLALLIQNVNIGGKESNNLLIQACREGWKDVIQAVLKKKKTIAGGILFKSFDSLIRTNHHDLLHCFHTSLNECNPNFHQSTKILDIMCTNYGASDTIPPILQSMLLLPCFAECVSSNHITILSPLLSNYALLKSFKNILCEDAYDSEVKRKVFETFRERRIDISDTVRELFYDRCSFDNHLKNTDKLIQNLIDTDYIDERQRIEGMKLCVFQDEIKNQGIARMIMRKEKRTLPFDKSDIFIRICKYKNLLDTETVDCVLELYRDDIDDRSLKAGIHDLLQDPTCELLSTVIVNTIIDRRVDIDSIVSSLIYCICIPYGEFADNTGGLLKYIMERYTDIISEDLIKGFNAATIYNVKAAIEICKAYPERITLTEYIISLLQNVLVDDTHCSDRIELINRLSDIFHVDKKTCMKFAEETIPEAERWGELRGLFGDSLTEDMTWKLVCLWCDDCVLNLNETKCMKEILSHSGINLTPEQIAYLKEKYPYYYRRVLPNEWFESW